MLLTKKERKKERNRLKTIPRPPTGGGVINDTTLKIVISNKMTRTCHTCTVHLSYHTTEIRLEPDPDADSGILDPERNADRYTKLLSIGN